MGFLEVFYAPRSVIQLCCASRPAPDQVFSGGLLDCLYCYASSGEEMEPPLLNPALEHSGNCQDNLWSLQGCLTLGPHFRISVPEVVRPHVSMRC